MTTETAPATDTADVDVMTAGIAALPSPTIAVASHDDPSEDASLDRRISSPIPRGAIRYKSPIRHHRRTPSVHREIKETLDARTEYTNARDGHIHHRINQYVLKKEIGRGSYGSVHLATDHSGTEYALKEFSKARLRRRARSNILRMGPRRPMRALDRDSLSAPLSPHISEFELSRPPGSPGAMGMGIMDDSPLDLIRQEIAIMKKLHHPNLVQLFEVLTDPSEDQLYIVLEMCKKGVVMKVGLDEQAKPYPEDMCKTWFRDLILGIEYLHAQGVIHRDIKPDNLLLSNDDVLKIVDFGVSEMFEKPDEMMTAKSAGSPAFLAPELCVANHGDVSGKAADIWSMGVTLYCLRYGKIPFEHPNMLEMYEAIRTQQPVLPADESPDFVDLMCKLLEKDPHKRIKMGELREHPWVTNHGQAMLLSVEENCANLIEPPNDLELNRALTRKMNHLLCVMKVMYKLKLLVARRRAASRNNLSPPEPTMGDERPAQDRQPQQSLHTLATDHEQIEALVAQRRSFRKDTLPFVLSTNSSLTSEPPYLGVGLGVEPAPPYSPPATLYASPTNSMSSPSNPAPFCSAEPESFEASGDGGAVVSDSPVAADFNIYDRAYEEELKRIIASPLRRSSSLYLNNHVREKAQIRGLAQNVLDEGPGDGAGGPSPGVPRGRPGRRAPWVEAELGRAVPVPEGGDGTPT